MDGIIKAMAEAPLANPLKLNIVEHPDAPAKKRSAPKRTLNMFDMPKPVMDNARAYRERQADRKVAELLDYYADTDKSVEWIVANTKIDEETVKRGLVVRGREL